MDSAHDLALSDVSIRHDLSDSDMSPQELLRFIQFLEARNVAASSLSWLSGASSDMRLSNEYDDQDVVDDDDDDDHVNFLEGNLTRPVGPNEISQNYSYFLPSY